MSALDKITVAEFGTVTCPICGMKNPVIFGLAKSVACIRCNNTFDLPKFVPKKKVKEPKKPQKEKKKKKPKPRGRPKGKANLSDCLDIAVDWLVQSGACTHYPGYVCDKDFKTPGVCNKCLRRYVMKLSRERNRSEPIEIKREGEDADND